jgi:hypothetical protein
MFNLAPTLHALTAGSPITTAIHEARRMARRHLETAGAAVSTGREPQSARFLVPADIDAVALVAAIEAKLRVSCDAALDRRNGLPNVLERSRDGRLVVPRGGRGVLERLGTGDATRAQQFLIRLMSEIRNRL